MKITLSRDAFVARFLEIRFGNFSYEGLKALYDYLTDYEESTGEELEFDPIALCGDFTEYESFEDLQKDYIIPFKNIEDVEEQAAVIKIPGGNGLIIHAF